MRFFKKHLSGRASPMDNFKPDNIPPDNLKPDTINHHDAFYFSRLPVSTEAIHAYTQQFFPPQKIKGHYIKRFFVGICIFLLRIMPHWLAYLVGTGIGKFFIMPDSDIISRQPILTLFTETPNPGQKNRRSTKPLWPISAVSLSTTCACPLPEKNSDPPL